jgi:DNA modification methylase
MKSQAPEKGGKLAVSYRPIDELIPYARNARTHSDAQVAQLAGSIKEFGWTNPILVAAEDGSIIAGHGRVLAARQLGLAEVPTIPLAGLSPAQRRALVLADNKLALNAGWDDELLAVELSELKEAGYDLGIIGFADGELAGIFAGAGGGGGLTDPEELPPIPVHPIVVAGDVWLLGDHRLVCGDSTEATCVEKALGGSAPHLMVTDPPYGVEYDPTARRNLQSRNSRPAQGAVSNDDRADWREAWALFPGDVAYVWHDGLRAGLVAESLAACEFQARSQIIWGKNKLIVGRGDYHWQHEACWYAVRKAKKGHWAGDRKQTTLWQIDKPAKSETGHSTQKPIECMRRPIENNSKPGDHIYEPFSGSGTTIIAAEMLKRICHAIELHPAYVQVAIARWQEFTGKKATLEGDGRSFDELVASRGNGTAPLQAELSKKSGSRSKRRAAA